MNVHNETIVVGFAEEGRDGELRARGTFERNPTPGTAEEYISWHGPIC